MVGQTLSHYKIAEKLGEGGMGVVYRAVDPRLDRMVAIKVLQKERMADPERKRRFVQEAKAASSLNHPNIITVYDIGTVEGVDYMVMEYVVGRTLGEVIGPRGLRVPEALKYGVQIADALATAHAAGIVHRDLKPSNVMVTDKGLVKVLDFGLAKLTERPESSFQTPTLETTLDSPPRTLEGAIVGTAAYMSPEQAEGKNVDTRSDIFSFGSMLYEMVTGRLPFRGGSQMSTLAAILNKEPSPASEIVEGLPPELERIILRCLRKEPERRVQHMDDLKVALEELREESVSGRLAYLPPGLKSTPEAVAARAFRPARLLARIGIGMVLIAATFGASWWWRRGSRTPSRQPILTRLTSDSGLSAYPAFSSDGKLLAYASDRSGEGNLDIWVQQIGGGEPIRLTRGEADDYEPAFSPDGTKIAFRSEQERGGIYVIPALGGDARLVIAQGHRPRFSPDGNWIAYWTGAWGWVPGSNKIFVVPSGGGQPKQVGAEFATARHPIWMGDGKHLLFLGRLDPKVPAQQTLDWWIAPLEGGSAVRTGALAAFRNQKLSPPPGEPAIVPDGLIGENDRLVFSASLGDTTNLWQVPVEPKLGKVAGEAERVTSGTGLELQASVATGFSTRRQVAFSTLTLNVDVWNLPLDANRGKVAGELRRLTQNLSFDAFPSVSADGARLAYLSARAGSWAVLIRDLGSGKETTLFSGRSADLQPKISGDGSKVAYWENRRVDYIVSTRGGMAEKVCEPCGPATHVSSDGQKILFESLSRPEAIILADLASREQINLIQPLEHPNYILYGGRFSPDERWISFHAETSSPVNRQIFIVPFRDRQVRPEREWMAVTDGSAPDREPYWSPDGNLLYFLSDRDGFRCIWAQRLDAATKRPAGSPVPVQHFHHARQSLSGVTGGPAAIALSVTRGGMVFALAELTGNIWMTKTQDQP